MRARYLRIRDLLELGEIKDVRIDIQALVELVRNSKREHFGISQASLALLALLDGRYDEAEHFALEAIEPSPENHLDSTRPPSNQLESLAARACMVQLAAVRREQGRFIEMLPIIEHYVKEYPALTFARCGLAFCCAEAGRLDEARSHFDYLAANFFAAIVRDVSWLASMALLSEVCVILNDRENAEILEALLKPYRLRNASLDMYVCYGPVSLYLGMLQATKASLDEAFSELGFALQCAKRMGSRPLEARVMYEQASVLSRRNGSDSDVSEALRLKASALATAKALGMRALEEKLELLGMAPTVIESFLLTPQKDHPISAAILFVDMVASTKRALELRNRRWAVLVQSYYDLVRSEIRTHRGKEIHTTGDGFLLIFDAPTRALRCVSGIREASRDLGIDIRAGLHIGEFEFIDGDIAGASVHVAARVAAAAPPGEVLVTSTVKDILIGSDVEFDDRGLYTLKGVPEQWRLYSARTHAQ
jgi:class 3 adenylate cyclase